MPQPRVFTVVLNSNRRTDTLECLASLSRLAYPNHAVVVLDNASTDGSVEAIAAAFPSVQVMPLTENKGYAGNNNVGIRAALEQGADWVFVLNEDTILDPGCLSRLVEAGERDPAIGIVGPMVYHHNEPAVIQSAGGRLDAWWFGSHIGQNEDDHGQYAEPREVDWISGCAILVRRAVIEQVGALDERFFYYWEETEWCVRARRSGWRMVHVPAAKLWHKGVQRNYDPGPPVTYYNTRNRLLMLSKHRAPLAVRLMAWWQIARTLASWTIRPMWRSKRQHRDALWRGAMDYLSRRWGQMPR
jgi:GT2 family glycosyltransferase